MDYGGWRTENGLAEMCLYFWSVAVNYRASYGITRVNRGYMHAALSGHGGTSGFGLS